MPEPEESITLVTITEAVRLQQEAIRSMLEAMRIMNDGLERATERIRILEENKQ